jgi:hypothetical protein
VTDETPLAEVPDREIGRQLEEVCGIGADTWLHNLWRYHRTMEPAWRYVRAEATWGEFRCALKAAVEGIAKPRRSPGLIFSVKEKLAETQQYRGNARMKEIEREILSIGDSDPDRVSRLEEEYRDMLSDERRGA